jgi:hypothetical protein
VYRSRSCAQKKERTTTAEVSFRRTCFCFSTTEYVQVRLAAGSGTPRLPRDLGSCRVKQRAQINRSANASRMSTQPTAPQLFRERACYMCRFLDRPSIGTSADAYAGPSRTRYLPLAWSDRRRQRNTPRDSRNRTARSWRSRKESKMNQNQGERGNSIDSRRLCCRCN